MAFSPLQSLQVISNINVNQKSHVSNTVSQSQQFPLSTATPSLTLLKKTDDEWHSYSTNLVKGRDNTIQGYYNKIEGKNNMLSGEANDVNGQLNKI